MSHTRMTPEQFKRNYGAKKETGVASTQALEEFIQAEALRLYPVISLSSGELVDVNYTLRQAFLLGASISASATSTLSSLAQRPESVKQ